MAISWKNNASCLLLLGVAIAAAPISSAADTADSEYPQINSIRVGIANHYTVGHWTPVRVDVDGNARLKDPQVRVIVQDSDGVETIAAMPLPQPTSSDGPRTVTVYTKVGRVGAPIRVVLVDGETQVDEQTLRANFANQSGSANVELSPVTELVAVCGAAAPDVEETLTVRDAAGAQLARHIVQIEHFADLPDRWFGYDAVDVLVIVADDHWRSSDLAGDDARFSALVQWVERGGRLVVLCGGEFAPVLLAEGGPLARLLPARFAEVVRLPETGRLQEFANSDEPIVGWGARTSIMVPRLVDVDGKIEAFAGQRPTDLPLVVRSARGLGEVAFAGVDLAKPPLANWPGRAAFLQALLRPYLSEVNSDAVQQTLVARGYNDLSGALRQRLGRSFGGVAPITFPIVTALAIAYLVVLGPVDYFVVHRWLRRPWAAWVTFPLAVVLFGGAALVLAEWRKGSGGPRVNRVELVDIDTLTGQARGTFWATLYSPQADQFDLQLALDAGALADDGQARAETLLSWWGLAGTGIGGMQARRTDLGVGEGQYWYSSDLKSLMHVPVLTASTKSLLARWSAPAASLIEAELAEQDGLVVGSIENRADRTLRNLRLFYGGWAYRLGNLRPGRRIELGEQFVPRRMKTVVAQDALGAAAPALSEGIVFDAERASTQELLKLMMFFEAAGGLGFAGMPSHYQAYCDLSRTLDVGRAILVADVETPGSRLVDSGSGRPLGNDSDAAAVVYRFVLPVNKQ